MKILFLILSIILLSFSAFAGTKTDNDNDYYFGGTVTINNLSVTGAMGSFSWGSTWQQPTNEPPWNIIFSPVNVWRSFTITNFICKAEGGIMILDLIHQADDDAVRTYTTAWTNISCSTAYSNLGPLSIGVAVGDQLGLTCTNMTGVGSNVLFTFGCSIP